MNRIFTIAILAIFANFAHAAPNMTPQWGYDNTQILPAGQPLQYKIGSTWTAIPLMAQNNTWTGIQTFSQAPIISSLDGYVNCKTSSPCTSYYNVDAINVVNYGAIDDDLTNNTTAVQTAATLASNVGSCVYFPARTVGSKYRVSSTLNWGNACIKLDPGTSIVNTDGTAYSGNYSGYSLQNLFKEFVTPVSITHGIQRIESPGAMIQYISGENYPSNAPALRVNRVMNTQATASKSSLIGAGGIFQAYGDIGRDAPIGGQSGSSIIYSGHQNVFNSNNGPGINITCDLTNGSAVLTNCSNFAGIFKPSKVTSSTSGIPTNSWIYSFNSTAKTITLNTPFIGLSTASANVNVVPGRSEWNPFSVGQVFDTYSYQPGQNIYNDYTLMTNTSPSADDQEGFFAGASHIVQKWVPGNVIDGLHDGSHGEVIATRPANGGYDYINRAETNLTCDLTNGSATLTNCTSTSLVYPSAIATSTTPGIAANSYVVSKTTDTLTLNAAYTGVNTVGASVVTAFKSYPINDGLRVVGWSGYWPCAKSGNDTCATPGYNVGIQIGGVGGSPWIDYEARSNIPVGMQIEDYSNKGIWVKNPLTGSTPYSIYSEYNAGRVVSIDGYKVGQFEGISNMADVADSYFSGGSAYDKGGTIIAYGPNSVSPNAGSILFLAGTGAVNSTIAKIDSTGLRVGSSVAPTVALDVTGNIKGSGNIALGTAATSSGSVTISNGSAGGKDITINNLGATAANYNFNLPATAGSSGQPLLSGGGGSSAMTFGTLDVAAGGTGITSGTSGGIPYFSASTTIQSSAALAANAIVIGGGVGSAPSTTTTGTGVITAIGNAVDGANGLLTYNLIGTFGTKLPLLSTANTWTLAQTFSADPISAGYDVNDAAGTYRLIKFSTGTTSGYRWQCGVNDTAEAGANAGSDFLCNRFDDSNAYAGTPLFMRRSNGQFGINTANPGYQLDVSGDERVTGTRISGGSSPTLGGTCATDTKVGGNTSGSFQVNNGAGCATTSTVSITFATSVTNGYACHVQDMTTPSALFQQTENTANSVTVTIAGAAAVDNDVIVFQCTGY